MSNESSIIQNKLIVLYLIDKMDIPLSNPQITQFAVDSNYMDYFTIQELLSDMVDSGYLDRAEDNNITRYTLTEEGLNPLKLFAERIPHGIRSAINDYVIKNRKQIKKDFEITANYFYDHDHNDFTVKCGLYEDKAMLMEVNLSVITKDEAKVICSNWKKNFHILYGNILSELVVEKTPN